MKIVSDHGFPRGDGSHPDDATLDRFKNERDYIAQSGRMKTTVAAMDWAAAEIEMLRHIARRVAELPYFKNARIEALVRDARDALDVVGGLKE